MAGRIRRLQVFTRLRPKTIERLDALAVELGARNRSAAIRILLGKADPTLKEDS